MFIFHAWNMIVSNVYSQNYFLINIYPCYFKHQIEKKHETQSFDE